MIVVGLSRSPCFSGFCLPIIIRCKTFLTRSKVSFCSISISSSVWFRSPSGFIDTDPVSPCIETWILKYQFVTPRIYYIKRTLETTKYVSLIQKKPLIIGLPKFWYGIFICFYVSFMETKW